MSPEKIQKKSSILFLLHVVTCIGNWSCYTRLVPKHLSKVNIKYLLYMFHLLSGAYRLIPGQMVNETYKSFLISTMNDCYLMIDFISLIWPSFWETVVSLTHLGVMVLTDYENQMHGKTCCCWIKLSEYEV